MKRLRVLEPSLLFLLFSNIATIVAAVAFDWSLASVLWAYWFQSIIIGFFTALKILTARVNAKSAGGRAFLGGFFCLHYGVFHLVYAVFLSVFAFFPQFMAGPFRGISSQPMQFDLAGVLAISALFFLNHLFSYYYNFVLRNEREMTSRQLEGLFIRPYGRVIPMHFTIILGGFFFLASGMSAWVLVFFLAVKAVVDLAAHALEHSWGNAGVT